jgi:hypothetical protein
MSERSVPISAPSSAPGKTASSPAAAARTKLLLEGPILPTLLRLAAPNIPTCLRSPASSRLTDSFSGASAPMRSPAPRWHFPG